ERAVAAVAGTLDCQSTIVEMPAAWDQGPRSARHGDERAGAGSGGLGFARGLEGLEEADDRRAIELGEQFEGPGDAGRVPLVAEDGGLERRRGAVVEVGRAVGDAPERRRLPFLRRGMVAGEWDVGLLAVSALPAVRVGHPVEEEVAVDARGAAGLGRGAQGGCAPA